jgi:hypothetical protein
VSPALSVPGSSRRTILLGAVLVALVAGRGGAAPAPDSQRPLSPRGGESWSADSLHALRWLGPVGVATVEVRFATAGGKRWTPVRNATDGQEATNLSSVPGEVNRLPWRVPAIASKRCRIQIRTVGGPTVTEQTSGDFTIGKSGAGEYGWQQITLAAAFAGRDGAGALTFQDRMWLLGGWNPGDKVNFPSICNSEVWSTSDGLAWTEVNPQAPWEGRHTAGYVVYQGKMWIVGGDCNQHHYQTDVWNTADGANWDQVTDKVPWAPRVLHHTVVFKGRILVLGGQTIPQFGGGDEVFYSDVWTSANGRDWTQVADHCPWGPRGMIGGSAVFNNRLWILGGGTYDTPQIPQRKFYNDVWSSADGVHWEKVLDEAPWHPRQYHDVAVWDGKLWVMEGYHQDGGNRKDVWYSADGVNWYELPNTPWAPRHAASAFVYQDALWMVAGNNMFPDVWKLARK